MSWSNGLAPHSAIIEISWETHEKKSDGSYYGNISDKGKTTLVIEGRDRALTVEIVNSLIDLVKKGGSNVSELEIDRERLEQSRIQGSSGPRNDGTGMLGMRGKIG